MKHLICILSIALIASSFYVSSGYVITGEIKNADGQQIVLQQIRNNKPEDIAVTTVQTGKFTFKGTTPHPEFCILAVGDKGSIQFFVENSDIHITVDSDNVEKSIITGSKENDLFMNFAGGLEKFSQQQKELNSSYVSLKQSGNATQEAEKAITAQMEKLQQDQIGYMIDFVFNHPGRIATAFIVDNILMRYMNTTQLKQVVDGFDGSYDSSQWVKMLKDNYSSLIRTEIGQPFPNITLKTPDDKPVSLSDYAGKGKYVLIDFWASWCGPCRNANPRVVELYNRYKDKGFEIVGISLDRDKKGWTDAIKHDNLAWPHMSDLNYWQSEAAKLYSVSAIPYMVLLDREGKIIAKGLHAGELAGKLAELMD